MQNPLRVFLSGFLLLTLVLGVWVFYAQRYEKKSNPRVINNFSEMNEEDLSEEHIIKNIVLEGICIEIHCVVFNAVFVLPLAIETLLDGHTGQMTPPPWG